MVYLLKVPDFEKVKKVSRWGQSWHNFRTKRAQLKKLATHNSYAVAEKNGDWSRGHTVAPCEKKYKLPGGIRATWSSWLLAPPVAASWMELRAAAAAAAAFSASFFSLFSSRLCRILEGTREAATPSDLDCFGLWPEPDGPFSPEPWLPNPETKPQLCSLTLLFRVHFHCSANNWYIFYWFVKVSLIPESPDSFFLSLLLTDDEDGWASLSSDFSADSAVAPPPLDLALLRFLPGSRRTSSSLVCSIESRWLWWPDLVAEIEITLLVNFFYAPYSSLSVSLQIEICIVRFRVISYTVR